MPFQCFAYGSNMFTAKMRRAAPSAQPRAIASLPGHVFRFNKHSQSDGSGKGNIVAIPDPDAAVWGVVFEIADCDRDALDASEGGYSPAMVDVATADGLVTLLTYIARPNRVRNTLRPYTWYKAFVVRGAEQHGLPPEYIEQLKAVEALADPEPDRERAERALLERS